MRVFTPKTLFSEIIEPSGLQTVQPLDTTLPPVENVIDLESDNRITSTSGAAYPHVVVRAKRNLGGVGVRTQRWTSVGLAMTKPTG
jgi:hypothetical protein